MRFASPLWLLLLILLPLVWWWRARAAKPPAVRFSSAVLLAALPASWIARWHWLPQACRALALVMLVIALARPQQPNQRSRVFAEGIAIQMVVDTSVSMHAPDFERNGHAATRLEVVKEVFRQFVLGDGDLPGRPNDLIGLVTFANFPDSKCPLTLSHEVLAHEIQAVRIAPASEGGTNIGDAIVWALDGLRNAKAKSKVLILLSDGVNEPAEIENAPKATDPSEAARIAHGLGVKIYTIGAGRQAGRYRYTDPETGQTGAFLAKPVDETLLKRLAEITDGKYFRASDADGLKDVYAAIDRLERTQTDAVVYLDYREWFPPLALAGLALLALEQLLSATRWMRV
jgi:Ca-activated chloride channel family protein